MVAVSLKKKKKEKENERAPGIDGKTGEGMLYYLKETTYCIANREIYSKNNDYKNYRCYLSILRLWKFQDKQGNLINLGG